MEKTFKFVLPSPSFDKKPNSGNRVKPHFLTPSGMSLLPREKQPPPMYGQRGATVPAKYLKPVVAEEPVPEPVKQYCEPCELELQSLDDYKRHRAQHEKCPVAGCQYKGHPTVMDKHINTLHSSGLFEKFKKLCSPEEIAMWREERRKRFPTVANVLLKQKAQEQRQKRGERLEATRNRFGKIEDRKRAQPNAEDAKTNPDEKRQINKSNNKPNQRNKKRNNKNRKGRQDRNDAKTTKDSSGEITKASPQEQQEEVKWHGLNAFRGTLQMKDYKHVSSKPQAKTENALFGLVGMYGSDDESEDEQDLEENEAEAEDIKAVRLPDTGVTFPSIVIEDDTEVTQEDITINSKPPMMSCETEYNEKVELLDDTKIITTNKELLADYPTETDELSETPIKIVTETSPTETLTETLCMPSKNIDICDPSNPPHMPIGNDVNSSDEAPEETPIQRSICEYKINPEKSKTDITPPSTNTQETPQKRAAKQQPRQSAKAKQNLKRKSGLDYRKLKIRKQNTMLEKLLESDIRHERNVLLQCVRYVCENNFFGVGSKPSVE